MKYEEEKAYFLKCQTIPLPENKETLLMAYNDEIILIRKHEGFSPYISE